MDMVSTLTISGSKDGLYRISRAAEGFWHSVTNIANSQANQFPAVVIEGASHGSFMDETLLPTLVAARDLQPDISQAVAHQAVATHMMDYIEMRLKMADESIMASSLKASATFYKPLVDSMFEEGSYWIRPPCYNISTINPDTPKECVRGSPFVAKAQLIQGGDMSWNKVTLNVFDNNHRCYSVFPHHLPEI